ncbi:MAG: hypothetical protein AseanaTS_05730 [Candidatus Pelagadaptatus aseana]|uniref:endonuclease/exonuclease/phosphatase family protein n=1 Tax=Candidatus Pelagadaptatus aseana TaxID=3120508 RepID=UPI0039B18139
MLRLTSTYTNRVLLAGLFALLVVGCSVSSSSARLVSKHTIFLSQQEPVMGQDSLTLVSLNMAHGRADSFSQVFLSGEEITSNLSEISNFLESTNADLVALQELDGPSSWSGNFSHNDYLAATAGYAHSIRSDYVDQPWGQYGSGVLSKLPVKESFGAVFSSAFPSPDKGFTLAEVRWLLPDGDTVNVDVVSVHLDFSRSSVREQQIQELTDTLKDRNNPRILMGDFNSDWLGSELTLKTLSQGASVHTFEPDSTSLVTYGDRRLDWILLSPELEFVDYHHSDKIMSDHLAIVARVRLKPEDGNTGPVAPTLAAQEQL